METEGRTQALQQVTAKPRLLGLVRGVLRRKHYSIRTEQSYVDWIKRFILFHGKRHPAHTGKPEVTAFLTHLAVQRDVAASTQKQSVAARATRLDRLQSNAERCNSLYPSYAYAVRLR